MRGNVEHWNLHQLNLAGVKPLIALAFGNRALFVRGFHPFREASASRNGQEPLLANGLGGP